MDELTIDREFASLCPDLTPEEYKLLEQSIIDDGCREPITIWANHQGTILDGHNRYKICKKHDVKFKVRALNLTRDAAMAWIIRNQCGRRNLSESQRALMAAKLANLGEGRPDKTASQEAVSQSDAAEEFGVSRSTVQRATKVIEEGAASLQRAVQEGEIPVKQAAVIADLSKAEQTKIVAKGPEAVAKKVKQIKEKKPRKARDFDTAKLDKELAKEKKSRQGRPVWDDETVMKAIGKFAQDIDKHCSGLLALYEQRFSIKGGDEKDFNRAKQCTRQAQVKCQELVKAAKDSFKMWK